MIKPVFIGIFIIAGVAVMLQKSTKLDSRGYRNNNAGNIKKGQQWQGLAPVQDDPVFAVFVSPEYGYRALAKLLVNYQALYGLDTVAKIITRYAPQSDSNHTSNYINYVASAMGVEPDQKIVVKNHLLPFMRAIAHFENGYSKHADTVLNAGIAMAAA